MKVYSDKSSSVYPDDILPLLAEMQLHGSSPNVFTLNSMIRVLCLVGGVREAMDLYRLYFDPSHVREEAAVLKPDVATFTTLLWGIGLKLKKGNSSFTKHILKQASYSLNEIDDMFLNATMHALVRSGDYSDAIYLLNSMLRHCRHDVYIDDRFDMLNIHVNYSSIIDRMIEISHHSKWDNVFKKVEFWCCVLEVYSHCERGGTVSLELMRRMKEGFGVDYNSGCFAHCIIGLSEQALNETKVANAEELVEQAILLSSDHLKSHICQNVHELGQANLALKRSVRLLGNKKLMARFELEVETLYFQHHSNRHHRIDDRETWDMYEN
jgi:pentatricopeptide repeat protein